MGEQRKAIRVIDVPHDMAAEEVERRLNEACDAGYYLNRMFSLPNDGGLRAIFNLRMKS